MSVGTATACGGVRCPSRTLRIATTDHFGSCDVPGVSVPLKGTADSNEVLHEVLQFEVLFRCPSRAPRIATGLALLTFELVTHVSVPLKGTADSNKLILTDADKDSLVSVPLKGTADSNTGKAPTVSLTGSGFGAPQGHCG